MEDLIELEGYTERAHLTRLGLSAQDVGTHP